MLEVPTTLGSLGRLMVPFGCERRLIDTAEEGTSMNAKCRIVGVPGCVFSANGRRFHHGIRSFSVGGGFAASRDFNFF